MIAARLLLPFLLLASVAPAAPRLSVVAGGLRLDGVPAGVEATAEGTLVNRGDETLTIADVSACCGATASVAETELAPGERTVLRVTLTPAVPGEIFKTVTVRTNDPDRPERQLVVRGRAVEATPEASGSGWTWVTVMAAGLADGFNPCAFSIVIVLAGILAAGGRRRRAQLAAGCAFCLGSFLTYMLMGLGLLQAMRTVTEGRLARSVVFSLLSLALLILSFLSFRDAFRYRRARVPAVITLQLPDRVKRLIRSVAEASWRGPSVFFASLGCGFAVTLLDSLCTGQVYVPVLALVAREPGAWRAFGLLAVYNLAFIAPLVAVFALAARGADAVRMSGWSKRNVIPSKIALGILFLVLALLLLLLLK